jgi:hypothetical protein
MWTERSTAQLFEFKDFLTDHAVMSAALEVNGIDAGRQGLLWS